MSLLRIRAANSSSKKQHYLRRKLDRLERIVSECDGALVAFSGGVDSTLLLAVAKELLGRRAVAATVAFPAFPRAELRSARAIAKSLGTRHVVIKAEELMELGAFSSNPPDRCYHCKKHILERMLREARKLGLSCVLEASNADDLMDYRPGRKAVLEMGVRSPLVEAGLSKSEIRTLSKALGLPNWDKPSSACLATRIPYGERITRERLLRIERAEEFLASVGLSRFRLRDHGAIARLETGEGDWRLFLDGNLRARIIRKLKALGFSFATVDLEGYRTGSMNELLRQKNDPL